MSQLYEIKPIEWKDLSVMSHSEIGYFITDVENTKDSFDVWFQGRKICNIGSIAYGKEIAEAHHRAQLEKHLMKVESGWLPIEKLNKEEMQFVMVMQDGAVRVLLWSDTNKEWEHPHPVGHRVAPFDICANPTHWMPLPPPPTQETKS